MFLQELLIEKEERDLLASLLLDLVTVVAHTPKDDVTL
jgi:hypothetical protein